LAQNISFRDYSQWVCSDQISGHRQGTWWGLPHKLKVMVKSSNGQRCFRFQFCNSHSEQLVEAPLHTKSIVTNCCNTLHLLPTTCHQPCKIAILERS
jgi:hypothetical protein